MSADADTDLLVAYLHGELSAQQMESAAARLQTDASFSRRLIMLAREDALLVELAHAASESNGAQFDPYHQWLGIRAKDQPPHHYRLLGIELYEDDPVVIENAADQRMAHLRTFSNSKHAEQAQKLLNEVAAAKICLLRAESKQPYDVQLRAQLEPKKKRSAPQPAALAVAKPITPEQPAVRVRTGERTSAGRRVERNSSAAKSWSVVAAVVAIAAVVVIAAFILSGNDAADLAEVETDTTNSAPPPGRGSIPPRTATRNTTGTDSKPPERDTRPETTPPQPPVVVELNHVDTNLVQTLTGHVKPVRGLAYSPDGRLLASCSGASDGTIRLWDVQAADSLAELAGHEGHVSAIAFSPDGKSLASAGEDTTVRLWDVESGELLHTLKGHTGAVETVAFSPSGETIASGGRDNTIRTWNVAEAKSAAVWTSELGAVSALDYFPNGKQLAVAAGREVELRDAATGTVNRRLSGHQASVRSLAVSQNGTIIVAGADDGAVRAWSLPSGQPRVVTGSQHSKPVFAVAISPDGDRLASGSGDRTVALWDLTSGQKLGVIRGKSDQVYAVAFAPKSGQLAVGGQDTLVRTWAIASKPPAAHLVTTEPPSSTSASGEPIDLLARVDLQKHRVQGDWRRDGRTLVSPNEPARLLLPCDLPKEYEIVADVQRVAGEGGLAFYLVGEGRQFMVGFDSADKIGSDWAGVLFVDGHHSMSPDNPTRRRGPIFDSGKPVTIRCVVQPGSVQVSQNGTPWVKFEGDFNRLSIPQDHKSLPSLSLGLLTWNAEFRITRLELRPLSPTTPALPAQPVDLLARVELPKHQLQGSWRKDGPALISPADKAAMLQLPFDLPDEYELSVEAQRIAGENSLWIFLAAENRQFMAIFDSIWSGDKFSFFQYVDGHHGSKAQNPTRRRGSVFDSGQPVKLRCVVRKDSVVVFRDDKPWIQHQGSLARLSLPSNHPAPPAAYLGLGSWESEYRITRIELRPLPTRIDAGEKVILAQRKPVPDAEAQKKALAEFEGLFGEKIAAAKKTEEKLALAHQFHELALAEEDHPATQFVLLRQAYDLALAAAGVDVVFQVVDDMTKRYQVDAWKARQSAFSALASKVRLPAERIALAERGLALAGTAAAEAKFDDASDLAEQSLAIATRARSTELRRRAVALVKQLKVQKAAWEKAQAAAAVLAANPDDPAANLAQGRYLCFVADQWEKGIPHLLKSGSAALAAAAEQELAAADPKSELAAADAWLAASQAASGDDVQHCLDRACHWYRQCVGSLEGLDETRAASQLEKHDPEWKSAAAGLVGHWKFDEGEGTVARDSVGTQHGQIGIHTKWSRDKGRPVLYFSGRYNDYVAFSQTSFGPAFTVAMWVKTRDATGTRILINNGGTYTDATDGWTLFYKMVSSAPGRQVWLFTANGKQRAAASTRAGALPHNEWAHVALTVDQKAGLAKIYINGKESQKTTDIAPNFGMRPATSWRIGSRGTSNDVASFVGFAADLRVYNRVLPKEAIANIIKLTTQGK